MPLHSSKLSESNKTGHFMSFHCMKSDVRGECCSCVSPSTFSLPSFTRASVLACHPGTCVRQPAHQEANAWSISFLPRKSATCGEAFPSIVGKVSAGKDSPTFQRWAWLLMRVMAMRARIRFMESLWLVGIRILCYQPIIHHEVQPDGSLIPHPSCFAASCWR